MVQNIKANGKTEIWTEKECIYGLMAIYIKGNIDKVKNVEKVKCFGNNRTNRMKATGKKGG